MSETVATEREVATWRAVALMSRRMYSSLERVLQASAHISVPDFEILLALSQADQQRARAGALGDMLSWEKSRISHHVSRMVARDLVARDTCDADLRGTWITLAPAGRAALKAAMPAYTSELRERISGVLSADDAATMGRSAMAIATQFDGGACQGADDELAEQLGASPVPTSAGQTLLRGVTASELGLELRPRQPHPEHRSPGL